MPYDMRLPEIKPVNIDFPGILRSAAALQYYKRAGRLADIQTQKAEKEQQWAEEDRPLKQRAAIQALNKGDLELSSALLKYGLAYLPMIQWDDKNTDWKQFRAHLIEKGVNENFLPEGFTSKLQFEGWRRDALLAGKSLKEQYETEIKRRKVEGEPEPAYEQLTIYGPEGKTKRVPVKKGEEYNPPEGWTLTKPDTAKKDDEEKALKRISAIEEKIYRIKTTGTIDSETLALLNKLDPKTADMARGGDKDAAIAALEKEKAFLYEKHVSAENRPEPGKPSQAEPGITHEFVPGKGLVEVGK